MPPPLPYAQYFPHPETAVPRMYITHIAVYQDLLTFTAWLWPIFTYTFVSGGYVQNGLIELFEPLYDWSSNVYSVGWLLESWIYTDNGSCPNPCLYPAGVFLYKNPEWGWHIGLHNYAIGPTGPAHVLQFPSQPGDFWLPRDT